MLALASVDLLDELLERADGAQAALQEVEEDVAALNVVLLTELATAAAEAVGTAPAAQKAVLVEGERDGTAVHAGAAEVAGAEASDTAVQATVEEAETPALLAAEEDVVSLAWAANHPLRLELDIDVGP